MCGTIPPLPNTPSWRDAQLKKAQEQRYLYLYHYHFGMVGSPRRIYKS